MFIESCVDYSNNDSQFYYRTNLQFELALNIYNNLCKTLHLETYGVDLPMNILLRMINRLGLNDVM